MPAAKKPAGKAAKAPAKKVEPVKDEPKVETPVVPEPTSPQERVDAPLERLADSKVVSVKKGVLTVDLAAIANSPQMEREARTAEVRKVLERFQQDPFGVIG